MRTIRHPLSGADYDLTDDGNILVTTRGGETGLFTPEGRHIEGTVRWADPHLCGWVAGPATPSHRYGAATVRPDDQRQAGRQARPGR